ncbi:hypothetical protein CSB45_04940 [candidate division KSB3 bacterium]|uniref:TIGR03087 family PEP-CTERM/XrtA system glycosyltransferase n=1 Tax=candidate division KSB3 bacterium TaxID=2044937 RepID=A0A2G6E8F8_9BACT|nr:MAG: hypothetical protein CSB45_04940 [candidate division KSB3 bacterium]PIE30402.1 MAG: hypothetical protein CSA57_03710 [candidate division KSB3 bacterium]
MNILFLTQRVPYPPNKGDKLRSFHEIRYLARRHQVALLCLTDDEQEIRYEHKLQKFCRSVKVVYQSPLQSKMRALLSLTTSNPLTLPFFYSPRLADLVRTSIQRGEYDLIFVYCSSMAQYVPQNCPIPAIIDFVDVDSEKWAQYAKYAQFPWTVIYRRESRKLRAYESQITKRFQHGFLVSEQEVKDFHRLVSAWDALTALPNGVDFRVFHPGSGEYDSHNLVFTGAMDYFANIEAMQYFCHDILPRIRKEIPDVSLSIVGSKPSEAVRQLAEELPGVTVTGFVESVLPYLHKAAVFVAPMRIARGVQNKILEAMAAGVPVVISSLGFEGLTATPGRDVFVEDDAKDFARQVISLIRDAALRRTVAERARKCIEDHYNWENNLSRLDEAIGSAVSES